ncbi:hypothetical protein MJG53_018021 [Ovis ammon polii x Ovis aries]|uniref:Uncharacterized protein n=1 Tax=Ovis ammon polii x Ovis aries TaxID=2918886 RepID=A0ACB9U5R6_9CETA|nr:hypothetical protein MJG53_018021 [Ovis ammon polii x Ovis aries]
MEPRPPVLSSRWVSDVNCSDKTSLPNPEEPNIFIHKNKLSEDFPGGPVNQDRTDLHQRTDCVSLPQEGGYHQEPYFAYENAKALKSDLQALTAHLKTKHQVLLSDCITEGERKMDKQLRRIVLSVIPCSQSLAKSLSQHPSPTTEVVFLRVDQYQEMMGLLDDALTGDQLLLALSLPAEIHNYWASPVESP